MPLRPCSSTGPPLPNRHRDVALWPERTVLWRGMRPSADKPHRTPIGALLRILAKALVALPALMLGTLLFAGASATDGPPIASSATVGPAMGLADSAALRATVYGAPPQDVAPMPKTVPL